MSDYTIVLADDHAMMREGIKNMIDAEKALKVVGEAGDGIKLLKLLKKISPNMVILDITMPGMRGIEVLQEIHSLYPHIHVLMLSMHKRPEFVSKALTSGARGFLLKEDSGIELIHAIDQIRNGQPYLSRKLVEEFHSNIVAICRGNATEETDPLTPRERQVLQMIAEGHTDGQIADRLCISIRTVHRHRANIRSRLSLKGTADLVRYAISRGYASADL